MIRRLPSILFLLLSSSCGMKHVMNDVPRMSTDLSCRKEVVTSEPAVMKARVAAAQTACEVAQNDTIHSAVAQPARRIITHGHVIATTLSQTVTSAIPAKHNGNGDPKDGHVWLIIFYFFVGIWLITWGGSVLIAGIFAASFFAAILGLFILVLGIVPMAGIISMMRGRWRRSPHYSEE